MDTLKLNFTLVQREWLHHTRLFFFLNAKGDPQGVSEEYSETNRNTGTNTHLFLRAGVRTFTSLIYAQLIMHNAEDTSR